MVGEDAVYVFETVRYSISFPKILLWSFLFTPYILDIAASRLFYSLNL